jgi:hypothetical protein
MEQETQVLQGGAAPEAKNVGKDTDMAGWKPAPQREMGVPGRKNEKPHRLRPP